MFSPLLLRSESDLACQLSYLPLPVFTTVLQKKHCNIGVKQVFGLLGPACRCIIVHLSLFVSSDRLQSSASWIRVILSHSRSVVTSLIQSSAGTSWTRNNTFQTWLMWVLVSHVGVTNQCTFCNPANKPNLIENRPFNKFHLIWRNWLKTELGQSVSWEGQPFILKPAWL